MEITYVDREFVAHSIPKRKIDAHKGDFGKILLLCGSRGYTGAAALAAMGALRSGAGLVYLGVPESIYAIEAVKLTEPIVFPLPDNDGQYGTSAISQVSKLLDRMDAVLIGPGIGRSDGCWKLLEYMLGNFNGPVVVDADGINLLSAHKDILRGRTAPTILTPHAGEFSRLAGYAPMNRVSDAEELARELDAIVVLKGHGSVITDGNRSFVNTTGNPGMAVGGSGDVLAGIIVSLLGQGVMPLEAAACSVWLHGTAGDICADELGQHGMLPTDILEVLPRLMK